MHTTDTDRADGEDISAELDPTRMGAALADLMNPAILAAEAPRFAAELVKVGLGSSALEISEDRRFADPAWQENPLYRLIGQSYLAWEQSVARLGEQQQVD